MKNLTDTINDIKATERAIAFHAARATEVLLPYSHRAIHTAHASERRAHLHNLRAYDLPRAMATA